MHYVVLAYPDMPQSDYAKMQAIRKDHDKLFTVVEPHFTLVFPTAKPSESEILTHVASLKLDIKPFSFTLTRAVVEENIYPKYFQVHLESVEPITEVIKLHDLLYVGPLATELREDIQYAPHITVGNDDDETAMAGLADRINANGISISGRINRLTVSSYDGTKVVDTRQFPLK